MSNRGFASWAFLVLVIVLLASEGGRAPADPAGEPRSDEREAGDPGALFTWVDLDGSGRLDLAVVNGSGTLQVLANTGADRFEDVTERLGLAEVEDAALTLWADYDGDGRLDLFVGARAGASRLFHRDVGGFIDVTAASGLALEGAVRSAQWLDLDGDGRLDLFAVTAQTSALFHGLEGGFFEQARLPLGGVAGLPGRGGLQVSQPGRDAEPSSTGAPGEPGHERPVGPGGRSAGVASPGAGGRIAIGPTPTVGGVTPLSPFPTACANSIRDQANPGTCLSATTTPTLGSLYPISTDLFVGTNGRIGLGTTAPQTDVDLVRAGSARLRIQSAINQDSKISLLESTAEAFGFDLIYRGTSNDLEIAARDGSSTAITRMAIDRHTGAVGIGTIDTAPARLTVGGPGASLWVANTDSGPLAPSSGTAPADRSGIRVFNNSATGLSTIQAWDYSTGVNAPRDLALNDSGGNVILGGGSEMVVNSGLRQVFIEGGGFPPDPQYKLDVNGATRCTRVDQTSCRDLKDDITPLVGALDSVLRLHGVSYTWNEKAPIDLQGRRDIGFVADEVDAVLPEIVSKDASGKPMALDYGKVTAVTVEAIKELKARNDELEARVARLEALLAARGSDK